MQAFERRPRRHHATRWSCATTAVAALAVMLASLACDPAEAPAPPATQASTQPATVPATTQATAPPPPQTYVDVVRASHPAVPATQPRAVPVDLREAAHLVLLEPIHVCSRGDLWITRGDADPAEQVLARPKEVDQQTHVLRDEVKYVHWAPDREGAWRPMVVRPSTSGDGKGVELVDHEQRRPLPARDYDWDGAVSVSDRMIVPTKGGLSVIVASPGYELRAMHHDLAASEAGAIRTPTQFVFDARGLLVWAPWDNDQVGSRGAVRLLNDQWQPLATDQGWAERVIQLVPLLDGSVLQIGASDEEKGRVKLSVLSLDGDAVDEQKVTRLVEQLSDPDAGTREKAYAELTRYGPGVWSLLERLLPQQPPEASIRIEQLLAAKVEPSLGGMRLLDDAAQVVERLRDGGLLLYAEAGVEVPRTDRPDSFDIVAPAWICLRPGRAIHLVNGALTQDAMPGNQTFTAYGDEWIVTDDAQGPRRLLGNHLAPMLRADERTFGHLVGIDQRGRWLFRRSPDADQTLILDPTLPDPTPRLPIWLMWVRKGDVGWDQNDWPVIYRGGGWVLEEHGWRPLDEKTNTVTKELPPPGAATAPATSPATTGPAVATTAPATNGAVDPASVPLLVDKDGNRYFDGRTTVRVVAPDGKQTVWPLPLTAMGGSNDRPWLVRDNDGRLFLYNRPGRILRIAPTPGKAEPFALEATFTHRVPNSTDVRRMWLDRAGRIAIAYDGDRLAILFPDGHIPDAIANMIPAHELGEN